MKKLFKMDGFIIFIRIMDVLTWSLIITAFILLDKARPVAKTILDNFYGKANRTLWLRNYLNAAYSLLMIAMLVAVLGLLINVGFIGDKKHHISKGMIAGLIFSGISVLFISINLL